jgi:formyl-CoA transferase
MTAGQPGFGALQGLRVLDLTQMLAGPFATMLLADQGADVIKIEPPGGDRTRRNGPWLPGALPFDEGGFGAYFGSVNRNKRSIVIDLKTETGRAQLLAMVAQADVLVENYRAGVMEGLGLSYETLAERNPRLVYAALRGFGDPRTGRTAYTDWPAYDPVAQAMGGIMGITGSVVGGAPTKIGPGVGDLLPAMFLAYAIAAACWHVQRTGQGQFVDVAMVDAVLAVCERLVYQYSGAGVNSHPDGNGHPILCPFGIFPAKDGHVSLGVPNDRLMGKAHLLDDPRCSSNEVRARNRDFVEPQVAEWTARHTKAELTALLGGVIPFGPVFHAQDIFGDEHFHARGMLVPTEQPGAGTPLTLAGTPVHMSRTPGGIHGRAPLVNEHAQAILAEFGLAGAASAAQGCI